MCCKCYSGATTGTGGRIRDNEAVGRGGHCTAGTAGYCVGNLLMPGMTRSVLTVKLCLFSRLI